MQTAIEWLRERYEERYHISEEMKEFFIQANMQHMEEVMEAYDVAKPDAEEGESRRYYKGKFKN
jgi:ATP phosphoribosyltransferase regulatory subunit HisZ